MAWTELAMATAERPRGDCGRVIPWEDWELTRSYLELRNAMWRQIAEGAVALAESWEREKQSRSEDQE
jgi:hypothetical protein